MKGFKVFFKLLLFAFVLGLQTVAAQQAEWVIQGYTDEGLRIDLIEADELGNVYLGGVFKWHAYLNGADLFPGQDWYSFIVKNDPSGQLLWHKEIIANHVTLVKILNDQNGDVYIAGNFEDTLRLAGDVVLPSDSVRKFYLIKLNPDGDVIWTKKGVSSGYSGINDLTMDSLGNLYATITYNELLDIDSSLFYTQHGGAVVIKMDAAGDLLWGKEIRSERWISVTNILYDGMDGVYVSGRFDTSAAFIGPNNLFWNDGDGHDAYIAKYDTAGTFLWAEHIVAQQYAWSKGLAWDGNSLYYFGNGVGGVLFGPYVLSPLGTSYNELAKYTPLTQDWNWAFDIEIDYNVRVDKFALGSDGLIYVFGTLDLPSKVKEDSINFVSEGGADALLLIFSTQGDLVDRIQVYSTDYNTGSGFLLDNDNHVYIAGNFKGTVHFGDTSLTQIGINSNNYVAKLGKVSGVAERPHGKQSFRVYPNPSNSYVRIEGLSADQSVTIVDLHGKTLSERKSSGHVMDINVSSYPSGVYLIRVFGVDGVGVEKVLVY